MSLLRWLGLFGGATNDRVLFPSVRVRHLLGTATTRTLRSATTARHLLGTTSVRTMRFEG